MIIVFFFSWYYVYSGMTVVVYKYCGYSCMIIVFSLYCVYIEMILLFLEILYVHAVK